MVRFALALTAAFACLAAGTGTAEGAVARALPGAGTASAAGPSRGGPAHLPGALPGGDPTPADPGAADRPDDHAGDLPFTGDARPPGTDPATAPGGLTTEPSTAPADPSTAPTDPSVPPDTTAPGYPDPGAGDPAVGSGLPDDRPTGPADGTEPAAPRDAAHPSGGVTDTTADPRTLGAHVYQGMGFDACTAPDLDTMAAWRDDSPYGAVGVYVGGRARSCTQPRLTRSWVRSVAAMGWRILPIFVGSQSPCASGEHQREFPIDSGHAAAQGADEGADAVRAAAALGILRDSPVYLDMESYDITSARCTRPVLTFIQAWDRALRARGYLPGFYSSADTGITQIEAARAAGAPDLPDMVWFARWSVPASLYGEPDLPGDAWRPHRRIHQYVGDTRESYDGYPLAIDRNLIDAPVAVVG